MADKDLLLVISEVLLKQDQTNDTLEKSMGITQKQFEEHRRFNEVCIKQFEEQYKFNQIFAGELKEMNQRLGNIEKLLQKVADLEDRVKRIEDVLFKS